LLRRRRSGRWAHPPNKQLNGLTLAEIRQRLGDPPSRINPLVIAALVSVLTACQERCIAFCYYKYYAIHKYDYVWYKEWPSE